MVETPSVDDVERTEEFYHVRFRDPDEFDEIRTPDWARSPAESVVQGSEVRTGHREGGDDWVVQSVLLPTDAVDDEAEARDRATEITSKIDE
ncbi:hypothetical protein ACFPYI_06320 [Halomarina salina]|uniref:Uncharacterized protein n=1 Tax=Halomarina salina TaxID=1872699 RepID=A0ABD5RKN3_9EURY|nr:hypothetical protein [Halomarina salina]